MIGGGPSGLAAATKLKEMGFEVALIERKEELGGILDQCIHDGFGTKIFGKALSGPEFAGFFIDKARSLGLDVMVNTYVKDVKVHSDKKEIITISPKGVGKIEARAVVYALGCRERTHYEIKVGGYRPCLLYTSPSPRDS